ncbi:hypothetical protein AB0M44_47145 [Streptosporangium subroseum]|uniref:hypothetical protein n=1 Tax=Streptosporangium subroseum TaxID=106412 RepID=UPI003439F963
MTKYGYVVFQLRAHVRSRPNEVRLLADLDGKGADTLTLAANFLKQVQGEVLEEPRYELAHRVDKAQLFGRSIMIHGTSGPYGMLGNSVHLDTGEEQEIDERTAMMTSMRTMLLLPQDSNDGFIFCERVGARHFKSALERLVLRPISRTLNMTYKVYAHVDAKAWSDFLETADVREITSIYRSTRLEDVGSLRGQAKDLRITAGGVVANRLGQKLGKVLSSLTHKEDPVAFNLDEYPDLKPGNPDNYERERLELKVGDGYTERLIVVEREQLPQFVYVHKDRLPDAVLRDAWIEHGNELLSVQGGTMGT